MSVGAPFIGQIPPLSTRGQNDNRANNDLS